MMDPEAAKPRLIVIMGPTGAGKTALAMRLADGRRGEIVSADSMQVYRGMDIGTAKPTAEERARIPHHLLDVVDPDKPFHVSRYCELAHGVIARLLGEKKTVFVAGGTGLYIRALLGGLIDGPGEDEFLRRALREEMEREGKEALYRRLLREDPKAAARIDPRDGVRIVRALEVVALTGFSIVDHQDAHRFREQPYEALRIGLVLEREELRKRIDLRTDRMIAAGLVDEVRRLLARGYEPSLKSMQSLGYRHIAACLAGRTDLAEATRLIKRDTYRYAKRQMTWFRAERGVVWLSPDAVEQAEELIGGFLARQ